MQSQALDQITAALDDPGRQPRSFLLHGVTGSGKTELYLRAMKQVIEGGQQAILLVPEIALTPQTVERVSARFPGRVAVLHSLLKDRQKSDQWWKIRDGEYDVVIGPRSALFAPLPDLGLIVIDEEHEWTYKQEEAQPFYHARRAALELARLTNAVVLMGSATPDVETYYHAQRGRHGLLELPHRIRGNNGDSDPGLARTEICDMRQELREGNRSIFSRQLAQALTDCIYRGQQASRPFCS
jgi:primosomal protein N' (replication factor Y)